MKVVAISGGQRVACNPDELQEAAVILVFYLLIWVTALWMISDVKMWRYVHLRILDILHFTITFLKIKCVRVHTYIYIYTHTLLSQTFLIFKIFLTTPHLPLSVCHCSSCINYCDQNWTQHISRMDSVIDSSHKWTKTPTLFCLTQGSYKSDFCPTIVRVVAEHDF